MSTVSLISQVVLWVLLLFLGFLLLGVLRNLGLLSWRLEQLETITPRRVGRNGLKNGTRAPEFTLPSVDRKEVALRDFAGRKVLLVFTQTGCNPCQEIVPALNVLQRKGELQVLTINNGDLDAARDWARANKAKFPVLVQDSWDISRRYQIFATPFAFLLDEKGVIVAKGVLNKPQHLRYVLARVHGGTMEDAEAPPHQRRDRSRPY
jgi:methylamine dehydrogenase accessory protein MauD